MKRLTTLTILASGLIWLSVTAQAGFTANDLYLGFNKSSASSDYLIDLGQPASVGLGGSSATDLSGGFSKSQFTSIFGIPAGVNAGVVGGQSQFGLGYDLYATAPRAGGAGNPAVAGSDLSGFNLSQSTLANAQSALTKVAFPASGTGATDSGKSWTANVSPTFAAGSFYGASGIDPSSTMGGSGIIYEDLWRATPSSPYSYQGYFTLDLSGSSGRLGFTPVPEPGSLALFDLGGLAWRFARSRSRGCKAQ